DRALIRDAAADGRILGRAATAGCLVGERERPFGRARLWAGPTIRYRSDRSGLEPADRGTGRAVSFVGSAFGEAGRTPRSPPIRGRVAAQRVFERATRPRSRWRPRRWTMLNPGAPVSRCSAHPRFAST